MKRNTFLYLLIATVVVLVLGTAVYRSRQKAWKPATAESSQSVLEDFPLNEVACIAITDRDRTLTLARKDGRWRVAERYDYPADFSDVSRFLRDLAELRAAQIVPAGESQLGRLELLAPDRDAENAGTLVRFCDDAETELGVVIFGKEHHRKPQGGGGMMGQRSWADGRYLHVPATGKTMLVATSFTSVVTDPTEWTDSEFFKIGDVQRARLEQDGNVLWQVARDDKNDDLRLDGLAEGEEQDDTAVRSAGSAFSWPSFTDIADPDLEAAATGLDAPKVYVAHEFSGIVYTVRVGKETDAGGFHMTVEAAYDGPAERQTPEDEAPEDKQKNDADFQKKLEENRKTVSELNERLGSWVYIVPKSSVDPVLKQRADLIKEQEEEEEEEEAEDAAPEAAAPEDPGAEAEDLTTDEAATDPSPEPGEAETAPEAAPAP